jgi:hypothetical protein
MRKFVLLLAFVCSISVSISYANDIKKENKDQMKVENASTQVTKSREQKASPLDVKTTPAQCNLRASKVYFALLDSGEIESTAWKDAKAVYNSCLKE